MNAFQRSITQAPFNGWPAIVILQGDLTLSLVPDVGGRLMGINFKGNEICFVNPMLYGKTFSGDEFIWPALCGDWYFPLWGGGKTWVAPESDWPGGTPHRDLDSSEWAVKDTLCTAASIALELQSPICTVTGLQITRRLSLSANTTEWTIQHTLTNCGSEPISCGIWDVLMLKRPGMVSIPIASDHHGPSSGVTALPGKEPLESLLRDRVIEVTGDHVKIQCNAAREFKCGFQSQQGRVDVHFDEMNVGYSRHSWVKATQPYAHGHPIEVFNAPTLEYFEVETHSPRQRLGYGDSICYSINERVYSLNEKTQ